MVASYPGTLRAFQTRLNVTDNVDAAHMNDVQDEIKAIQKTLAINPQNSTAGGGSTLGAWSGAARSYASLSDRLANIEAGIVADAHSQYAKADGATTFTGTKTFVDPLLLGDAAAATSSALTLRTGTTGGSSSISWHEGTGPRWSLLRDQGSAQLRLRDTVNARDHTTFTSGTSSTLARTDLASTLTVAGDLSVSGAVTFTGYPLPHSHISITEVSLTFSSTVADTIITVTRTCPTGRVMLTAFAIGSVDTAPSNFGLGVNVNGTLYREIPVSFSIINYGQTFSASLPVDVAEGASHSFALTARRRLGSGTMTLPQGAIFTIVDVPK